MCLHMFKEEETALKPFRVYQSSALSFYSTGNLNYYYIISYPDSLPTATYSEEIRGCISHQVKVKQVTFNIAWMSIDILFKVLATEWLSLVFRESVMADHLLGPVNWQAVLPLNRYLRAFYWLHLLLMLPDGLVNLGDAFWSWEGITQSSLNH